MPQLARAGDRRTGCCRRLAHRIDGERALPVVITGTADSLIDGVRRSTGALSGIRLDEVARLGHAYPDDFAERLAAALRHLAGRGLTT